jgi:hypothetical protein
MPVKSLGSAVLYLPALIGACLSQTAITEGKPVGIICIETSTA